LAIHKWNPSGPSTQVAMLDIGGFSNIFAITSDLKHVFYEMGDTACPGGVCAPSSVGLASIAADYSSITFISKFQSNCTNTSFIQVLRISPGGGSLIVGCFVESMAVFDISDLVNIKLVAFPMTTGLGETITPAVPCQFPGGLTGSGYSDGTTLPAWIKANQTTVSLNALTQPDPYQIAEFPTPPDLVWCASTERAKIISLSQSALRFFDTSSQSPFSTTTVLCPGYNWAGTIAQNEVFYHLRDPSCNCPNKQTLPCPPGMILKGIEGSVSDLTDPFNSGFFLVGRDYIESTTCPLTTEKANVTFPVALLSGNASLVPLGTQLCPTGKLDLVANDPRVTGKVVVVDYDYNPGADCGADYGVLFAALGSSGATAVVFGLPPGSTPYWYAGPPQSMPVLFGLSPMVDAVRSGWTRVPVQFVPSPSPPRPPKSESATVAWSVTMMFLPVVGVWCR